MNKSAHAHELVGSARELEQKLRSAVRGEVRFDAGSRALYATDASNYRQVPIGVVLPRSIADVQATVGVCRDYGAAVLSRGGGTSLAGQCCNSAVILDFSKYMRSILSLDPEQRLAVVEPGIVLDRVREAAEQYELTFAPDPATHNRCTLGGMIGNNSCGTHALMGGKTVDNVHSLDVLLYDGTRMTTSLTSDEEYRVILARGGRQAEIYRGIRDLRDRYADEIRRQFPKIPRRVSGYNLDELLPENGFNIARALVGSEGTLVTVLQATVELKHSPQCRRLVVLGFPDVFTAADSIPEILRHNPIGLEGMDGLLIEFARRKNIGLKDIDRLPTGNGILFVEFGADSHDDVDAKARDFKDASAALSGHPDAAIYSGAEAQGMWHIRESGLGATVFVPGEPHSWEGWEDAAVPPEQLGVYLRRITALMGEYGYRSPIYGHFGQGCVHLRINFDFESEPGIRKFREFIDRGADLVVSLGGSLSGEHGDGQSRAALLPKMFGPEIMRAFREFKMLWDPENRMNPGKLVDPVNVYQPTENLRIGAGYKSAKPETFFQFPQDNGSFGEATMRCVGVGVCRKQDRATMCPSYMATLEEKHSTRGRAHLLWEMLEKDVVSGGWKDEHVHEALDLCLSCKACKSECPVNVDMATYKAEFLAQFYKGRSRKLQHYAFGFMDRLAHLASLVPGVTPRLANLPLKLPVLSDVVKGLLEVAPQRSLPQFAARSFQSEWRSRPRKAFNARPVILWPDTWNNYYHPQTLRFAAAVLEDAGCSVRVPSQHVCCGRPLYDFGFLKEARTYLERTLQQMGETIDANIPFVFLEPSCASVFREELTNFFPHDARAQRLCSQALLLSEFLARYVPDFTPAPLHGRKLVLHGHCHHTAVMKMDDELAILRRTGAEVELLDSGCCGMAGPFGFEKHKFSISQVLAERVLLPAIRHASEETLLVTDGFSCREQIAQNSPRRAIHFAEAICRHSYKR